jgi:hypothetical protein
VTINTDDIIHMMDESNNTDTISDVDDKLINIVGTAMKTLATRIKDPAHPLHRRVQFDEGTGRPIMPDDDVALAALVLALLDEPSTN